MRYLIALLLMAALGAGPMARAQILNTTPPSGTIGSGSGVGPLAAVPAATTDGTPLACTTGVRFYVPSGAAVTYTIAAAQPVAAPAATVTITGPVATPWSEPLAGGQQVYVTAASGAAIYRCM